MAVGYSGKSLFDKLGIKEGFRIFIQNPPNNYIDLLGEKIDEVILSDDLVGPIDFIHFFVKTRKELETGLPELKNALSYNGMIWVSWPKKISKGKTDLNDNIVRSIGLLNNLVDVKVCAVDEIWSGLKFVYRLKDRK